LFISYNLQITLTALVAQVDIFLSKKNVVGKSKGCFSIFVDCILSRPFGID